MQKQNEFALFIFKTLVLACRIFSLKDLSQSGEVPQMKTVFALHGPGYELNSHLPNRKSNVNCVASLYPQPQDKEVEIVGPPELSGH